MTELAKRAGWNMPENAARILNRIPVGHIAGLFLYLLLRQAKYFIARMVNALI